MRKQHVLGTSVHGRPIHAEEFEYEAPVVLVIAGVHGDEPQSAVIGDRLIELLTHDIGSMMRQHVLIIPRLNPDGLHEGTRVNANGVDLNRNFPTANWKLSERGDRYYGGPSAGSEPETQLVMEVMRRYTPRRILAVHCIDPPRHCVNYDGPALRLAETMAAANRYDIRAHIGHPTPGSMGTWIGYERKIPMVTLEMPSNAEAENCWTSNRDAIVNFIIAP